MGYSIEFHVPFIHFRLYLVYLATLTFTAHFMYYPQFLLRFFCLFFLLNFSFASAQSLFDDEVIIELTLEADLSAFLNDRGGKPSYHNALLSVGSEAGKSEPMEIEIRARGRFRRDKFVCVFPPVRFKFSKKKTYPEPFANQGKIKVVTHCQEEEEILKEYYLYKAYNLLTPKSFRVRLAKILYVDTSGKEPTVEKFAFLIESEEEMAMRNGESPIDEEVTIKPEDVDQEQLVITHLFNYMIANKDFEVEARQNLKIITNGSDKPIVVPYDFDWAGIVEASYTIGRNDKGSVYFTRRIFKPLCRSEVEFQTAIEKINGIKEALFELYESSPYLSEDGIKTTLKYYKNFYKHINKGKTMKEVLLGSCN